MLPKTKNDHSTIRRFPLLAGEASFILILASIFTGINYLILKSSLVTHCNPGIAFGIELPMVMFLLMWAFVIGSVAYLLYRERCFVWGYTLILAGGIANMVDRILHGCVIDYIRLVPWNVFNVADVSIFIGALLVLWYHHMKSKISN